MSTRRRRAADIAITAGLLVVLAGVATAMTILWRYKQTPGAQGDAPAIWPAASAIRPVAGKPTLVMFAHPRCPCSRASLAELREVMSSFAGKVTAEVWLDRPDGVDDGWVDRDGIRSNADIPGVTVHVDDGGREAARFGALTSGHVVLYDRDGRLAYQGGITGARGHAGDNPSEARLMARLRGDATTTARGPVYGCAMQDPR